jgi:hypothetical protein
MIQMIKEPNAALRWILLEWNGITVDNFHNIIDDVTKQGPHDSFISLLQIDSVKMVHNRE